MKRAIARAPRHIDARRDGRGEPATFAEVTAWSGCASALGSASFAAAVFIAGVVAMGEPSMLLALFLAMAMGVVASIFTAFPLGILIGWPVFRLVGATSRAAGTVGLVCAAILWSLWPGFGWLSGGPFGTADALAFHVLGTLGGWLAHRFAFH